MENMDNTLKLQIQNMFQDFGKHGQHTIQIQNMFQDLGKHGQHKIQIRNMFQDLEKHGQKFQNTNTKYVPGSW